jgi:membrane-bound lytic murein transglycosylase D
VLQSQLTEEELAQTTTVEIQGKYNSVVIANHLVMDINEFNRLNPHFDKMVATDAGYSIRLPKDKMELFNANRYIILHQSILATLHSASMQTSGYPAANPSSGAKKK